MKSYLNIPTNVWFQLPLSLRQKWWRETDYGKQNPSLDLLVEMESAIVTVLEKSTMEGHGDVENK